MYNNSSESGEILIHSAWRKAYTMRAENPAHTGGKQISEQNDHSDTCPNTHPGDLPICKPKE